MYTILTIILAFISVACIVIGWFQFKEKGFLFNNAYIYASKKERETMNKTPHFRQSAVVFCGIGIIFLLNTLELVLKTTWLNYLMFSSVFFLIMFAIISSIFIVKKYK